MQWYTCSCSDILYNYNIVIIHNLLLTLILNVFSFSFLFLNHSGGKECEGDMQYYPFRMTPYLMKVQDTVHAEDQFCCLLLAERVHSGYEGK